MFVQSVHYLCAFFWDRKETYTDRIEVALYRLLKDTLAVDLNGLFRWASYP